MAADFSEETVTERVQDSFANTADPRLREVLESLTEHLHSFVREVEPNQDEWATAIDLLTRVGQACDAHRQEFVLLSDVLGVSMLVDAINHRRPAGATESTVLGPFHVVESPVRGLGDAITAQEVTCLVRGTVHDLHGSPVPGARLDVWQADDRGEYDVQRGARFVGDLRGLFTTDRQGRFWFRTVVPSHYPIPDDGPVGELLRRTGRHPFRPAHIHLIVTADGYSPVTTHVFVDGSPYLDDDTVFGVKQSLVRAVQTVDDPVLAGEYAMSNPFRCIEFDPVLAASG